jgi:crotonobetainyl-CoA:carnitine CoA-transferase CaiB-like acyl-CoA transferase
MTGGRRSRDKGAAGELEVLDLVRVWWPRATRNFASGAAGNSDIAHGPAHTVIECKRTERLRLRDAWRQVEHDAQVAGVGTLPVLATRWNGTPHAPAPWLAITELEEVLSLIHLRETR